MLSFEEVPVVSSGLPLASPPVLLTGRRAILAAQPRLQALADRSGQAGLADTVDYFLTQPYTGGKLPHLLLFPPSGSVERHRERPGNALEGAVLIHQYRLAGLPLGVFVTDDDGGERTVLGPAQMRSALAIRAAQFLLRARGAHLVLLSLQDAQYGVSPSKGGRGRERWACTERTLLRRLPLLSSYEETLNTLGAHTRRNFRLFRRRAIAAHDCAFVPRAELSEEALVALNTQCDYPVPRAVAQWRYRSVHAVPGGVLAGVRASNGQWISMVGGRRSHGSFTVDWQMNNAAFAQISPATLMRGYLMEHEAGLGTHSLFFHGGTPHSMQSAFQPSRVVDLLASAGTVPARLLVHFAARSRSTSNFLLGALAQPGLRWERALQAM